jgi:hypothetical protein
MLFSLTLGVLLILSYYYISIVIRQTPKQIDVPFFNLLGSKVNSESESDSESGSQY